MPEIEVVEVVGAPADVVFDFVSNFENNPRWEGPVLRARKVTPGPVTVGTMFSERVRAFGMTYETTARITRLVPPREVAFEVSPFGPLSPRMRLELEPVSQDETRVAFRGDPSPRGLFRLFGPLIYLYAKRTLRQNLSNLKNELAGGSEAGRRKGPREAET